MIPLFGRAPPAALQFRPAPAPAAVLRPRRGGRRRRTAWKVLCAVGRLFGFNRSQQAGLNGSVRKKHGLKSQIVKSGDDKCAASWCRFRRQEIRPDACAAIRIAGLGGAFVRELDGNGIGMTKIAIVAGALDAFSPRGLPAAARRCSRTTAPTGRNFARGRARRGTRRQLLHKKPAIATQIPSMDLVLVTVKAHATHPPAAAARRPCSPFRTGWATGHPVRHDRQRAGARGPPRAATLLAGRCATPPRRHGLRI